MSLKKLKKTTETEVSEETTPIEETEESLEPATYPENINSEKKEALENTAPEDTSGDVSTKKMNGVLDLIQDEFSLSGKAYTVSNYADKGGKVTVSMSNADYDITVTVKDVYGKGI